MSDAGVINERTAAPVAPAARPITAMFQHPPALFAALDELVLPPLLREARSGGRRLRAWDADCGDGDTLFAVAVALRQRLPDLADWRLSLLATAAEPEVVARARRASFDDAAFAHAAPGFRQRHFRRNGDGRWTLLPPIRRMVEFARLDLAGDPYPSLLTHTHALDLILWRPRAPLEVSQLEGLARCLRPDGWLLLGAELSLPALPAGLLVQHCGSEVSVLRREPRAARRRSWPVAGTPAELDRRAAAARAAYRSGDYEQAGTLLSALLAERTDDVAAIELLARCDALSGRPLDALAWCQRATTLAPTRAAPHCLRACVLLEQGAPGEAMHAFQRALYLDPGYLLAHFGLGQLARRLGRLGEAERHFSNALALARRLPPDAPLADGSGVDAGRLIELILAQQAALAG